MDSSWVVVGRTVLEAGISEGTTREVWVQAHKWLKKVAAAESGAWGAVTGQPFRAARSVASGNL
jgi:hypothetical protein